MKTNKQLPTLLRGIIVQPTLFMNFVIVTVSATLVDMDSGDQDLPTLGTKIAKRTLIIGGLWRL